MRIRRGYVGGDHYPTVRAWMVKLGTAELDQRANATKVTVPEASDWVKRLRPATMLTVRAMPGSEGRGGRLKITLDRRTFEAGCMSLGTVLHEIAHSLVAQRWHDYREARQARAREVGILRLPPRQKAPRAHGEEFCRVYARLLREHVQLEQPYVSVARRPVELMQDDWTPALDL